MRNLKIVLLMAMLMVISACSLATSVGNGRTEIENSLVFVQGGTFLNTYANYYSEKVAISDFYISQYEITQQEWMEVMESNPSSFQGDHRPVEMVSWYDAIEYCNQRSIQEGLEPYYHIDKTQIDAENLSEYDDVKWTVMIREGANGYRLPTEAEWEYAASGGQLSKGYLYSGSDEPDEVAWYWRNAGDEVLTGDWNWPAIEHNNNQTKPVGLQKPNELGLYDMSGNVREWCWDWYADELHSQSGSQRVAKGGGWIGDVSNTEIAFRGKFEASGIGPDQGLRIVRDA